MFRSAVILCLALLPLTDAYVSGAPASTCDTLQPGHGGSAQNKLVNAVSSPFTINVLGPTLVGNNETVSINLGGSTSRFFKGFVIVAEWVDITNTRYRVGTWSSTDLSVKPACGADNSGMTHRNNNAKSTVQVQWKSPPAPFTGSVSFWGSFVERYNTYWIEISGQTHVTVGPPITTTTPLPPQQADPTHAVSNNGQPSTQNTGSIQTKTTQSTKMADNSTGPNQQNGTSMNFEQGPHHPQLRKRTGAALDADSNGCRAVRATLMSCLALVMFSLL